MSVVHETEVPETLAASVSLIDAPPEVHEKFEPEVSVPAGVVSFPVTVTEPVCAFVVVFVVSVNVMLPEYEFVKRQLALLLGKLRFSVPEPLNEPVNVLVVVGGAGGAVVTGNATGWLADSPVASVHVS